MKFSIYFFLLICINFPIWAKTVVVLGTVDATKCSEKMTKLWVSEKSTGQLLYQADVPHKSKFEIKLKPNQYKFVLNNQKGCLAEVDLDIKETSEKIVQTFSLKKI
jgi:hypothetical protein